MLEITAVILIVVWGFGLISFYSMGKLAPIAA